jgi:MraZ protein
VATRFVGRYEHSLDGKGRIILPARFRSSFESLALVSKYNERCLAIWTPEAFDRKADEMALLLDGTPEERARARAWSMGSAEVDLDRQGRVAIPSYLREFAGLADGSTVLVHGALNHIELWNPDAWGAQGAAGDAALTGEVPVAAATSSTGSSVSGGE